MTPEGIVIDGGLGAVAVVSVRFTMCTDGVTVGCIPNTLPLRPSSGPAVEPRSPSVTPTLDTHPRRRSTTAFCFCLTDSIARTCSIAVGSSRCIVKPITTGEIGVKEPVCTSGLSPVVCMCRGADKRVVSRRQVGHVESDTTNCHSSPFRRRIRGGPRERRWKCCDISY